jgi:hypothetical protein
VNRSLKAPLISTLTILFLALVFPLLAQEKDGQTPLSFSPSSYRVGERLTYNVQYSNFPSAAHVEVEVVARGNFYGRDAIQLRAHVETTGVINVALYSINNDYVTYIDAATGLPFRSEESARDAIKSAESVHELNPPAGNEAIPPRQRGFPGTYDLLSAFYRARALPLAPGASYDFSVRNETVEYQADLRVVGRDMVRTNVGSFSTVVAQIRVDNAPIRNVKVYFSDDERHVPVLMTGRLKTGDIRAELAGSELVAPAGATPTPTPVIVAAPVPVVTPTPTLGDNIPFKINEALNYQVFVGDSNAVAGVASFQVKGRSRYFERDGLFLTVNAYTTGAAGSVFFARDQIDSYVDPKALLPYRTVMNIAEGQRRLSQTLNFTQETGFVTSDKGAKIEIPVGTHDYLSFFYVLRTLNLIPNKKSAVSMLVENKPKTLFVDTLPRETIQLGGRGIPAIPLKITTDDPQPDKFQLRVWISADAQRLPLRITCMTKLGLLRADLAIVPTTPQ